MCQFGDQAQNLIPSKLRRPFTVSRKPLRLNKDEFGMGLRSIEASLVTAHIQGSLAYGLNSKDDMARNCATAAYQSGPISWKDQKMAAKLYFNGKIESKAYAATELRHSIEDKALLSRLWKMDLPSTSDLTNQDGTLIS